MNLNALQNALKNVEGAKIYPNGVASSSSVQLNPASWGLDRVDQMTGLDSSYTYLREGSHVDVYIVDSGDHEDFGGPGASRASYGIDYTGEGNQDDLGHGTHVAGTLH
jgi:subtilisin family serine protease